MDQIGAIVGPLLVALILYWKGSYQDSFAFLLLPAILALTVLFTSRFLYPKPQDLEIEVPHLEIKGLKRTYWIYMAAAALIALGFADFPLIAYHFQKSMILSPAMIPIFYAVAMGVDALAALIFGRLFDRVGIFSMAIATLIAALFAPLVFLGGFYLALLRMALWGEVGGYGCPGVGDAGGNRRNIPSGKKRCGLRGFQHGFWCGMVCGKLINGVPL